MSPSPRRRRASRRSTPATACGASPGEITRSRSWWRVLASSWPKVRHSPPGTSAVGPQVAGAARRWRGGRRRAASATSATAPAATPQRAHQGDHGLSIRFFITSRRVRGAGRLVARRAAPTRARRADAAQVAVLAQAVDRRRSEIALRARVRVDPVGARRVAAEDPVADRARRAAAPCCVGSSTSPSSPYGRP